MKNMIMGAKVPGSFVPQTMNNARGETFFVGKDVAEALGYSNPQKAFRDHIDSADKTVNDLSSVRRVHFAVRPLEEGNRRKVMFLQK